MGKRTRTVCLFLGSQRTPADGGCCIDLVQVPPQRYYLLAFYFRSSAVLFVSMLHGIDATDFDYKEIYGESLDVLNFIKIHSQFHFLRSLLTSVFTHMIVSFNALLCKPNLSTNQDILQVVSYRANAFVNGTKKLFDCNSLKFGSYGFFSSRLFFYNTISSWEHWKNQFSC